MCNDYEEVIAWKAYQAAMKKAGLMPAIGQSEADLEPKERIEALPKKRPHEDQWVEHPVPTKDQPFKKIKYVTALGHYDIDHLAALMDKANSAR